MYTNWLPFLKNLGKGQQCCEASKGGMHQACCVLFIAYNALGKCLVQVDQYGYRSNYIGYTVVQVSAQYDATRNMFIGTSTFAEAWVFPKLLTIIIYQLFLTILTIIKQILCIDSLVQIIVTLLWTAFVFLCILKDWNELSHCPTWKFTKHTFP